MTTPAPRQIYAELREAEGFVHHDRITCNTKDSRGRPIECLACMYAWLHGVAHERSVGDEAKVRVVGADPTGELVHSKEGMRRDLGRAAREMERAIKALRAAESALLSAQKRVPTPRSAGGYQPYPATPKQIRAVHEAREAQAKRRANGELIP